MTYNDPTLVRDNPECPVCGAQMVQIEEWEYECSMPDCSGKLNTEPDWDSEPGGHDDY